jgi:cytochrome c peroxidase
VRERGAVRSLRARQVDVTELRQLFGREGFGGAEHHTPGVVTTTSRRPCVARSAGRALYAGRPEGIMKTFPLRGIKDTPPYLHDGRCPMLEDSVGFNLILGTNLTGDEKKDLVADLRGL